jgi:hypothetical protein
MEPQWLQRYDNRNQFFGAFGLREGIDHHDQVAVGSSDRIGVILDRLPRLVQGTAICISLGSEGNRLAALSDRHLLGMRHT